MATERQSARGSSQTPQELRDEDNDSFFADDDEGNSTQGPGSSTEAADAARKNTKKNDEPEIGEKESKVVSAVRILVFVLLLAVTGFVAWGVYSYVNNIEKKSFENDFDDSSDKVLDAVGSTLDRSLGAVDNLMVNIVSHQEFAGSTWPNVTLPNFGVIAQKVLSLSRAAVIGVYPRVLDHQRQGWEAYAVTHDSWVNQSLKIQRDDPNFKGMKLETWNNYPIIHSNTGPIPQREKYYPQWQASPIVPVFDAYAWDLYELYSKELDEMEKNRVVTVGYTLNVHTPGVPISDPIEQSIFNNTVRWISGLVGPDQTPTDPLFPVYYPIVVNASNSVTIFRQDPEEHPFMGVIAMTMFWRELIQDILSPGSEGVILVIQNDCGQAFTYQINGPDAVFLGKGDLHDPAYDKYAKVVYLHELESFRLRAHEVYTGFPISTTFCPYSLSLYPSDMMKNNHETNNPLIFMFVAISIFAFTSAVFIIFDVVSERRQKKVLQVAVQSSNVVSSLFPSVVRDRLFQANNTVKAKEHVETPKLRLQQFLRNGDFQQKPDDNAEDDGKQTLNAPIAEFFSDTTVLFADIAGFTAWSSTREPAQVFTLLETLYSAFDRIATRRGVFKVETIGDSYVAVTGLPEPRADHAVVMAKFARDMREKMIELTKGLGRTLGPDTTDLQLRIGMNSGPVTAGVLRGERARFQLFGDTVNTAARMESTGVKSRIQVSQSTADLLIAAGKAHWVTKREEVVEAKGKGKVQTYFVEPTVHGGSSQASLSGESLEDDYDIFVVDEKIRELVEWHVDIMAKLIKQIIARREARLRIPARKGSKTPSKKEKDDYSSLTPSKSAAGGGKGDTVLDEVIEVIMLPEFDPALSKSTQEEANIELSPVVMAQLQSFITLIASLYQNNPFHNFAHASHVTMSVVKLLSRIVAPTDNIIKIAEQDNKGDLVSTLHDHTYGITSDPLTQFACVFSALIHDVDHPGVPNMQLVKENSPLVTVYKGKSLAEQNSVDISWRLFLDDQFEDLRKAICSSDAEMARFRQLVVNIVMATDIMDKDLKKLRDQRWDKAFQETSRMDESLEVNINRKATIVIEHLIQASDVAHTMQHWHIFRKWNERLFVEIYKAYQAGRAEKNPAEYWYQGEMGFFDFYIIPLAKKLKNCGVFGVSSDEYLSYAMKNREEWEHRGQEIVAAILAKYEESKHDMNYLCDDDEKQNLDDDADACQEDSTTTKEESTTSNTDSGAKVSL